MKPVFAEPFFALVRRLVVETGNQSAVARAMGLSASYISKIVRGEASDKAVRETTVVGALTSIGYSLDDLLAGNPISIKIDMAFGLSAPAPTYTAARPADAYDLVRAMDARELRAFRAWFLAWTDPATDSSAPSTFYESETSR